MFRGNFYKHDNIYHQVVLCFQDTIPGKKRHPYCFLRHVKAKAYFCYLKMAKKAKIQGGQTIGFFLQKLLNFKKIFFFKNFYIVILKRKGGIVSYLKGTSKKNSISLAKNDYFYLIFASFWLFRGKKLEFSDYLLENRQRWKIL